ncbi:mechanosensitive ion channel family protein [Palleronia sp.]|uniref:mechanosensitive ion channel family protein n=1 Tax=Palleronia sp. TaxID=1940284 RepID=UPI0035C7C6CC
MTRRFLLLFGLLIVWGFQTSAQTPAPVESEPPRVAVEDAPSDEAIAERLKAILAALERDGIAVSVESGVVTLSGDVADPAVSEQASGIANRLEGVVAVRNDLVEAGELSQQLDPALSRFRARFDQVLGRLPLLFLATVVFAAILGFGVLLARMAVWDRLAPNAFIAGIYRQGVRIVCGIAGLVVALDLLGAAALLGTILGAAGIIGLAIGFAVRDTVENFVASVMLSLRQPFRPNDLVEIEGDSGRVIRLTSRATILLSLDGNHIRIPNSVVFKSRIVNYTRSAARRFTFDIGVDPDADLESTRLIAQDALRAIPFVLEDPEALVWIENLIEAGAILRISGWINQEESGFASARGDALRLVKAAIEGAGVTIPDTTYRIRIEGAGPVSPAPPPSSAPRQDSAAEPDAQSFRQSEEKALIPLVAAEREETGDLLRKDAPQE